MPITVMWPKARQRTAARRRALEKDLRRTLAELQTNESQFQLASDPFYMEQVIYEHAALKCRCSALLQELRGGGGA